MHHASQMHVQLAVLLSLGSNQLLHLFCLVNQRFAYWGNSKDVLIVCKKAQKKTRKPVWFAVLQESGHQCGGTMPSVCCSWKLETRTVGIGRWVCASWQLSRPRQMEESPSLRIFWLSEIVSWKEEFRGHSGKVPSLAI